MASSPKSTVPDLSPDVPRISAQEPIAIIGLGCRLPGGVSSLNEFWDMLVNEKTGQGDMPSSRFNIDAFYHPDKEHPGSVNMKGGYFLQEDIRTFENSFFGINNLEATYMDPQQRKLLEVVYESFESAGARLEDVSGSNTGVYVGNFTMDFQVMQTKDPEYLHRYSATGMGTTILSNRVSHVFNLQGPSMVLDTACSSSLYCLHTAVMALRNYECDAAIAAGVNLIQSPEQHIGTMKAGVLSKTSICHSFGSLADGYGRADGVGAVYVKRLSDAIANRDPIRAVIRGSAVNANGRTPGITQPSSAGQEAVIRKAHLQAGLDLKDTCYIEAHGTGTPVGDPIEVRALANAFSSRPRSSPLMIGSVKPNLGHSEAASGISSLIKVVLALERGIIPPTANVGSVNPEIKAYDSNVEIVTRNTPWPCDGLNLPRQAGINSFGYGGANAHLVLESSDTFVPTGYHDSTISCNVLKMIEKRFLLHFSASSPSALTEQVSKLRGHAVNLVDLAYTLETRRSRLSTHGFVIARQSTILEDLQPHNLILNSTSKTDFQRGLTFVFTGQGAQWAQMGKGLLDQYPSFRSSILKYDAFLKSLKHAPSWSLIDTLTLPVESSNIDQATRAQPACTAIQIALVDLLSTWEIRPSAVIGHSSGEIAAAYASGFLTSKEALTIAYYRGYVVGNLPIRGQMMAIGLGQEESQAEIERNGLIGQVLVACVNSPNNVTLSGDADAIDILYSSMSRPDIFRRRLLTDNRAYHSHHMAQVGDEYESLIRSSCTPLKQRVSDKSHVKWVSSVSLEWQADLIDYSYWRRNLEQPVLFEPALRKLMNIRPASLLEVGPHGAMKLPIKQTQEQMGVTTQYFQSLTRGESSDLSLLKLIGHLCLSGAPIPLNIVNGLENIAGAKDLAMIGKVSRNLPPYPWRHDEVLWQEPRASIEFRNRKYPRHELLGSLVPGGNLTDFTWRNVLNPKDVPWIQDHRLDSTIVFPAAGYIAMAMEAVFQALGKRQPDSLSYELSNVNILAALTLSSQENMISAELLTSLRRQKATATSKSKKWWDFEILSLKDGRSTTHATGSITVYTSNAPIVHTTQPEPASSEFSAVRSWYRKMKEEGLNFGKRFQTMKTLYIPRNKTDRWAIAEIDVLHRTTDAVEEDSTYTMHPTTIDGILQTAIIAGAHGVIPDLIAQVPVAFESAVICTPSAVDLDSTYTVFANSHATSVSTSIISTELRNMNGKLYAAIRGMRLTTYSSSSRNENDTERHPMLRVCWKPDLVNLQTAQKELEVFIHGEAASESASSDVCTGGKLFHMSALTQLICHKNPQARIMYLLRDWSDQHDLLAVGICMASLGSGTHFHSFGSFFVGKVTSKGIVHRKRINDVSSITEITSLPFEPSGPDLDIIIVPEALDNSKDLVYLLQLQNPNGVLLILQSGGHSISMRQGKVDELSSWETTSICGLDVIQKRTHTIKKGTLIKKLVVVENEKNNALGVSIKTNLSHLAESIATIPFDAVSATSIPPNCTVVVAIETLVPLLSIMDEGQMTKLKTLTDHATNIVWLTSSGALDGHKPDMALVNGLSRSLMLEQPSLSFFTLDVESQTPPEVTVKHIAFILSQKASSSIVDYEFVERDSLLHISRFLPDNDSNDRFRGRLGKVAVEQTLAEAGDCILDQSSIGLGQKPRFKKSLRPNQLQDDFVEIEVMAVGISERDNQAVLGKAETRNSTCAMEFTGIVKAIGASVSNIAPGERVVVMAPNHFCLVEQVPAWACQKLEASESFTTLSTMFEVYAIAQYALHDLGHVLSGEYVLIHIDPSGIGLAAIRIAQLAEAKVICTVFTPETRDYLIGSFGFDSSHVFVLDESSYLANIMAATNGRGVDIVLNVHHGDLLRDSWKACADFGRFVDISSRTSDTLDIRSFSKQLTYTAFQLETLFCSENRQMQHKWTSLMHGILKLYRSGLIRPLGPVKILDVSELPAAYRSASAENQLGKVVVSLESRSTIINVLPPKYNTVFSPEKTYFLVGCLGGLGSALAKWMVSRGAQKFTFLGRSGTDRPSARNLVEDLKRSGANVSVVRGDVESMTDVQRAVDSIEGTLGGVIQAAMGLSEALFTNMSNRAWHAGIGPKLRGTWIIHKAIASREEAGGFDFFLMTSSVSGSVGTATESNYCAANHFLDAFARYRNFCNKPAVSLGLGMISEVGYLHENQEIEEMLLRKGIQAINEEELLQIVDISLSSTNPSYIPSSLRSDPLARSHILTGLEPLALKKLRDSGFDVRNPIMSDPRASLLAKTIDGLATVSEGSNTDALISKELNQAIKSAGEGVLLRDIIAALVIKQFCNLILVAVEKLDSHQPLSTYGMDSMLAADFRSWMYRIFKADVPFLDLLSSSLSLDSLIDRIEKQVLSLAGLP